MKRASGILLPISSLPSKYGIGAFSKEAYKFVDKLVQAGQSYWQILPLGPTSYGDSPYQSFSTFAGNPYFIDLDTLIKEKLLTRKECNDCDFGDHPEYVDYGKMYTARFALLRKAFSRSNIKENPEYQKFVKENAYWLDDYALYMAVKKCFGGKSWKEWAQDIRLRWGYSLDYYRTTYPEEIEFYKFLQFKFMEQWIKLKSYANVKGIQIIGDLPIYVAFDSADSWANPQLFQYNSDNLPVAVAGCPPDYFSATGQLWGNPLYSWAYHRETGYDWWCKRMRRSYELYDIVRIDHFRGFDEYYSIPYGDKTAVNGHWEKGPGMELFNTLTKRLGKEAVIAEDLGLITEGVKKLVKASGYPNMKVLQFAFEPGQETGYLPHEHVQNCVVYTGTHDNDTIMSWYKGMDKKHRSFVHEYINVPETPEVEPNWMMIRVAMMSCANLCIIPMQDFLGLGTEARINFPSTTGNNWKWRMKEDAFSPELVKRIKKITKFSFRALELPKTRKEKEAEEAAAASAETAAETTASGKEEKKAENGND